MNKTFFEFVVELFTKKARSQEDKGIEKYGQELNPMDNKFDWLNMAEEELIDGFKYLVAERERRDHLIESIINDLNLLNGYGGPLHKKPEHYIIEGIKHKLLMISHNVGDL